MGSIASTLAVVFRFLKQKTSLTHYIILSIVLGLLIGGLGGPSVAHPMALLAKMFIRAVKALIVPLIFSTLVVGIAGHSDDAAKVGRLFGKSLIYFEIVTTIALAVGLLAVNIAKPGVGVVLPKEADSAQATIANNTAKLTIEEELNKMIPESFFHAAAANEVMQVVVSAIIFSVALLWIPKRRKVILTDWFDAVSEVMFQVTWIVMLLAPLGIMGSIAAVIGKSGFGVLKNLAALVGTLYAALAAFAICVLLPIMLICRIPVREFVRAIGQPTLLAFSTASSEAALPLAMERMQEFGVPMEIVSFVLPTGYSFNLDGTTLYLAMASVFAAQAGEVSMTLGEQLYMMLVLMIMSKGVAAVPRASLVVLAGTCKQFNLPQDVITLLLGVDAFMDMARTSVNLIGNCLASVVVAKWERCFRVPGWEKALAQRKANEMEMEGVRLDREIDEEKAA